MKIGLLTPAWPGTRTANGIATAVRHLAAGLEQQGHAVTILARTIDAPHNTPRVIQTDPAAWSITDKIRARIGNAQAVAHAAIGRGITAAARQAIDAHGIEALIIEETQGWAQHVAPSLPIPVIVTLHGPWFMHKSIQMRGDATYDDTREAGEIAGLAVAAGVTAPSLDVLATTQANLPLPDVPQEVIPNPIPVAGPPDLAARDPNRLLFIGRFDRHKGGDTVIEAFARLARTHPDARLTFAGPDWGVTRKDAPDLHLPEVLAALPPEIKSRIEWLGPVGQDEIAPLRASHGVTVIASRYENLNYTLLEALAVGASIVCTNVGGPGEVLTDGQTALLVPPDDPEAMAEAMARMLGDPALARQLADAAHADALARFSPAAVADQTVGFLQRVL